MNGEILRGKRILMFSTKFFGYCDKIANQLREFGCEVDLYDERPTDSVFSKIFIRKNFAFYSPRVKKYFSRVISENSDKDYDYVFVIRGEAISPEIIAMLREAYSKAQFVLYLWDAVKNIPDCERKIKCYDRALTFDPVDAKKYGMLFRPLFFCKEFEGAVDGGDYKYDVAFIGTAHSIRPTVVAKVTEICKGLNRRVFSFLFLPHPFVYIYNKLTNSAYRNVKKADISFNSMSFDEINKVYSESRCVLDIEHNLQRGLTMRTIEMLGMHKKIITTNSQVADYDFYNPDNICIIDAENPVIDEKFFEADYSEIPKEIFERYTLRAFAIEVLGVEGEQK